MRLRNRQRISSKEYLGSLKSKVSTCLVILLLFPFPGSAQEESTCAENVNKKAVSLYEKGTDRKKYDFRERVEFLRKAVELEPEYVPALFELSNLLIKEAKADGKSFKPAEKYLLKVIEVCPDYNPYAYFYLGQIAYGGAKYPEAVTYLQKFVKVPENAKNDEDYNKANQMIKESKFFDKMFNHPVPFDPKPVAGVCTFEDEYLAMLSPDNEQMFFTRKYMKQSRNELTPKLVEEFMQSKRKENGFDAGLALDPPFNVGDNYGGATFSIDNKHMFITVCKPEKQKGGPPRVNCDIYTSDFVKGEWTQLRNLGPNVNTSDGWEAQPSLASDGKTLFFASARADSKGMDIYVSERLPSGEWSAAKNVGAPINTDQNEKSPFIHSDSQTLYFSSDGHEGLGGYDVFFTRKDSSNAWIKPKNIGYPINSENDEVGFFVSTDGKLGYFASNTLKGKGAGGYDVFHFDLYKEARPEKVMFLKGELKDELGQPLDRAKVKIQSVESKKVTEAVVDSMTGEFAAVVTISHEEKFLVSVKQKDVVFNSQLVEASDTATSKPMTMNFEMKFVTPGASYQLNNIYYSSNSAELLSESRDVIREFAEYLKEHSTLRIEIQGHTDNVGSAAANLALSTDRAFTVYTLLQEMGVDKSRITFKGYGPNKPIASNDTPEGRAKNRRTEFIILSK